MSEIEKTIETELLLSDLLFFSSSKTLNILAIRQKVLQKEVFVICINPVISTTPFREKCLIEVSRLK